ncbi:hypothetical protein D3X11_04595 [Streptococcus sp. X16XC17]|nr:hypothetical protein D3X11_04595 [Streptococcus sp. X16XC17]
MERKCKVQFKVKSLLRRVFLAVFLLSIITPSQLVLAQDPGVEETFFYPFNATFPNKMPTNGYYTINKEAGKLWVETNGWKNPHVTNLLITKILNTLPSKNTIITNGAVFCGM